jgi:hypothetical protein
VRPINRIVFDPFSNFEPVYNNEHPEFSPPSTIPRWEAIMVNRNSGKREVINTGRSKRFTKRDPQGQFKESAEVPRSLRKDVKQNCQAEGQVRIR